MDDFLVCAKSLNASISVEGEGHSSASASSGSTISKAYNANTGVFTVSGNSVYVSARHDSGNCWGASSTSLSVDVYLVKGNIKQL